MQFVHIHFMEKSRSRDEYVLLYTLLRELREEKGVTQETLAKKLNTYHAFISRYESGERRLDVVELDQICTALDTDVLEFVENFKQECKQLPKSLIRDRKLRERI